MAHKPLDAFVWNWRVRLGPDDVILCHVARFWAYLSCRLVAEVGGWLCHKNGAGSRLRRLSIRLRIWLNSRC